MSAIESPVFVPPEAVTGRLLTSFARMSAELLFAPLQPFPVEGGISKMAKALEPKLAHVFGTANSANAALAVLKDEKGSLVATAGVVVGQLPVEDFSEVGDVPRVCYLMVEPSRQGRGVGSKMLNLLEQWCKSRGFKDLYVLHLAESSQLHRWYSRVGYESLKDVPSMVPSHADEAGILQTSHHMISVMKKVLDVNA